jgi:protoporphyrinogen oxidase
VTRVAIVGGGIGGAAAALQLAREGSDVVLVERSDTLGGLVTSFSVAGTPLECFYHHVFPHETAIIGLIDELGLGGRLGWFKSSVGVLTGGRVWPFTSPVDLVRFAPIPLADRLRAGVGSLRMARAADWEALDSVPALEWLRRHTSAKATEVVWKPLLRARFGSAAEDVPAAWMWARFKQRSGARRGGGERLGYLRGGFRQLFDALERELRATGVDVRTATTAERLLVAGGRVAGVETDTGAVEADAVLFAGQLPRLANLLPPDRVEPDLATHEGLGNICVVAELRRPLSDIYWTNVCDAGLPFGALIEHTNLLPAADYGGRRVVYLGRYFTADDPVATADLDVLASSWLEALSDRLGTFALDDVIDVHPFRTPYAAPLVGLGYRRRVPPAEGRLPGLYLATTAQIYPQDRGMDEAVRLGRRVAARIADTHTSAVR